MTLLASFHYSVADAQQASRRVHKAMSEPGVIVSLPLMPGQRELSSAASALLLTREEGADTLWLDPQIDSAALRSTLNFCTGMPLVSACNASLALSHARANPDPATLMARQAAAGHNRTLIIELPGLTGGLTLAPTCLVFWHYLTRTRWQPLGPSLISQPVNWRARHLVWYLLLFVISLWLQLGLPAELSRFTPFCLALPIIALAWHYGWQGALIATLMNAIALIASQTWHDHPVDLLLSLLAQSLTGLLLGAGIQRLRELNHSLQSELARNRRLAERLVETEESVRQEVARELHDDIGQTITAIRTQAGIVQRVAPDNSRVIQSGVHIEQLSLGVYDAVRRLLGRLRPRQLDDLSLEQAIRSLMREMELEDAGIVSHLHWRIDETLLSEAQRVTLFRICQEALNNVVKHASASAVILKGWQQDDRLLLVIEDDGCGLPPGSGQQRFGLVGMRERVTALGGSLTLSCTHGTRVSVHLPLRAV